MWSLGAPSRPLPVAKSWVWVSPASYPASASPPSSPSVTTPQSPLPLSLGHHPVLPGSKPATSGR